MERSSLKGQNQKSLEQRPRELAIRVLTRVLSEDQPLDEALEALAGGLTSAHRAWLQEVCSGTLRWKGRLDSVLDSIALKKKPSGWLRKMLLLAAYQIVVQERAPKPAVVSETVSAIRNREGEAPAKFANAVLRKVAAHSEEWRNLTWNPNASLEEKAAWGSLPPWLWKRLETQHGTEWTQKFALACLERPLLWIRARDLGWHAEWAQSGPIPGAFEIREGGLITERGGFETGDFFVQDISNQLLVKEVSDRALSQFRSGSPGRISFDALDLCAAPGGKAAGLSWQGWEVTASDRGEKRLALLRSTAQRLGGRIRVISPEAVADLPEQDLVWVDAPCTGSGIIRRHPDVRWLRKEKDVCSLTQVQRELLLKGWNKVKPGGFLAYSVCSVLKDEGTQIIESSGLRNFQVHEWFLIPQEDPKGDGFWGALLEKKK